MYFFKADFGGVSLFIPLPKIIASPMISVTWESSGRGWFLEVFGLCPISRRLKCHQENKVLGREYLETMTLLLSLVKCLFIWLGQEIFSRRVHNVFSASC